MENEQSMTSVRVAANVREIRKLRGLDLSDVSARLDDVGQPISISGLSKLETGSRRVAVDDLVALALVLDVTPSRLLLTATARADAKVQLAPKVVSSAYAAWEWALGLSALPTDSWTDTLGEDGPVDDDFVEDELDRIARFRAENRPQRENFSITLQDLRDHDEALRELLRAAETARERTDWSIGVLAECIKTMDFLSGAERWHESDGLDNG